MAKSDLAKETPEAYQDYLNALFATAHVARISQVDVKSRKRVAKQPVHLQLSCPFMSSYINEAKRKERQAVISLSAIRKLHGGAKLPDRNCTLLLRLSTYVCVTKVRVHVPQICCKYLTSQTFAVQFCRGSRSEKPHLEENHKVQTCFHSSIRSCSCRILAK